MAKKGKSKVLSLRRATTFFKNKLGSNELIPVPKDHDTWVDYFMVSQEVPRPFRSWLEVRAYYTVDSSLEPQYEPGKYPYTIHTETNYIPDVVIAYGGVTYWLECKGRFRTMAEAKKYLDVRKAYPDIVLTFVLERANVATPGSQKRKDGTKRTMEEWLESNGFEYTYVSEMEEYINESIVKD